MQELQIEKDPKNENNLPKPVLTIRFNQMDNTSKTQKSIVRAARKAFLQHGYGGARMQEIADQAKVNKALLHYHFRNKEKLFRTVLNQEARRVARPFAILSSGEVPYPEKLRVMVSLATQPPASETDTA
jgi:AcrR family transcriptional regulator